MQQSKSLLRGLKSQRNSIMIAGFLYAFTFQKYETRDALSQSVGFQGALEAVLIFSVFLIVVLQSKGKPKRYGTHATIGFFGIYGIFALASSINSFNVQSSIVKGGLYLTVLATAYLLAELQMSRVFLDGVYRAYIATLIGALTMAAILPAKYPLFSVDSFNGRTRLTLLSTHPNSVGEVSGLLFLLAQVLPIRTRWYWQAFLLCTSVLAGEKTATAAVAISSILIFLFGNHATFRRWRFAIAASALVCAGLICIEAGVLPNSAGTLASRASESIYGTEVSNEVTTLDGRAAVWAQAAELAKGCILLGFGFDGARNFLMKGASWAGHAHNGFLQAILTAGLVGLLAFIVGLLAAVKDSLFADSTWRLKVLSLYLYLFWLAMVGPVFDSPSFFTILLFVSISYLSLDRLASWKTHLANATQWPSAIVSVAD